MLLPALVVTICTITVVVCIRNKHCPLYSQRRSHRRQPRVGILVRVDGEQDHDSVIKNSSIKYHAIETTQGMDLISSIATLIMGLFQYRFC